MERGWRKRVITCMDRLHKVHNIERKTSRWIYVSVWRLTRKQTTSRPDKLWPEMWKHMSDASKCKEKHKWTIEKPKLDHARSLRGIYFVDPKDEEFKDNMKNARRK